MMVSKRKVLISKLESQARRVQTLLREGSSLVESFQREIERLEGQTEAKILLLRKSHSERLDTAEKLRVRELEELAEALQRRDADTEVRRKKAQHDLAQRLTTLEARFGWGQRAWSDPAWEGYLPVERSFVPDGIRCGMLTMGESRREREIMPAFLPIIGGRSVLFSVGAGARHETISCTQSLMLRLLASLPPSKIRFLLIDPIGLGANVAPFLGLPDELYSGKVWTEPVHIEQRLAELNGHMETVIQTYLQDRFSSMEEYNLQKGGQVAEAYRIVVIHDFPTGFSESSFRRLVSIARNGVKTGVYAIIVGDPTASLPHGCTRIELEEGCNIVDFQAGAFRMRVAGAPAEISRYAIRLDEMPEPWLTRKVSAEVVAAAKRESVVRIPFDEVARPRNRWWDKESTSANGISTVVGFEGVNDHLRFCFDDDTVHGLMVGRTGSGKSTLLHALIIGLATTYAPSELCLYLVDFKKGIEFKGYAVHRLPQAHVIAIESEREFGLSILRKLDRELERRGKIFRSIQANSIRSFREARPDERMPRILLVVDEFHEFFSEDDDLAREAGKLMDRIVRQGRSFGVHMLLASQNLGSHSLHSLSQGTLDQMAIRVALRCTETDSRRILGDDNGAAKMLSRPGEAIYNDANGLIEGNRKFQVVWLADEDRERFLREISQQAIDRKTTLDERLIIFEGNEAANLEECEDLSNSALRSKGGEEACPQAWIGEPVSIDSPLGIAFPARGGRNLLIAGRSEVGAAGMMVAALVSFLSRRTEIPMVVEVLDLSARDSEFRRALDRIVDASEGMVAIIDKGTALERLCQYHEQGNGIGAADANPRTQVRILIIFGLHRLRELRGESEYMPSEAAEHLHATLRDGPERNLHVLAWTDSFSNLERMLQRAALQEFGVRIALRMPPAESDSFLGASDAGELGPTFALLSDEDRGGAPLRFRPYSLPGHEVLGKLIGQENR